MPANALQSYNTVGAREDLEDMIYMTSPTDTPFISSIDRTTCDATYHEWQRDTLRAPASNAQVEGFDATYNAQTQPERIGNRTQIISDTLSVTGTTEAIRKAGRKNNSEVSRLAGKKMIELKKDVEYAAISNPVAVVGSTSIPRQMRGLFGWIATNSQSGSGGAAPNPSTNTAPTVGTLRPENEAFTKTALLQAYSTGGDVDMIMVSPTHKQLYSAFTGNVTRFSDIGGDKSNANSTLNTAYTFYGSDFGTVKVVPNRVMAASGAGTANTDYFIDTSKWALATLTGRGFHKEELAKVGDAENYLILTEVTLVAREERASAAVRDIQ